MFRVAGLAHKLRWTHRLNPTLTGRIVLANIHVFAAGDGVDTEAVVRKISVNDVFHALRMGYADFLEKPSHYVFVVLIYPIMGIALFTWASGGNFLQLLFPLTAGFALLGPFAAIGLYEISRRRELKMDMSWKHALDVRHSPALPAILAVGALLLGLFGAWVYVAQLLFVSLYGNATPDNLIALVGELLTTQKGWMLIILGNGIGFVFALTVLCTTVIAFPLLLDRDVGARTAIATSIQAVVVNPVPMLSWGVIVALCLFLGSLPGLAGLIVALPVLGHATWHIYRTVIEKPS